MNAIALQSIAFILNTMFITKSAYKSPVSAFFTGRGEVAWSATELALQQIWFLVQLEEIEAAGGSGFSISRTVLLFDFQNVEQFIQSDPGDRARLKSVHIVTPGHVNGSDNWQMDQIKAVWQGREPVDDYEIPMDIFETVSGKKYSASFSDLSIEELAGETLKFQFSH
jgi:hypothetical protein